MLTLSIDSRVLGWRLGLGDLGDTIEICHGYANACRCSQCMERAEGKRKRPARQPWERAA